MSGFSPFIRASIANLEDDQGGGITFSIDVQAGQESLRDLILLNQSSSGQPPFTLPFSLTAASWSELASINTFFITSPDDSIQTGNPEIILEIRATGNGQEATVVPFTINYLDND